MPCPSARVCGEPGARGGSAGGTEPSGDRNQPVDSGSVRDQIEGLGPRVPLSRDGEEAEKQERGQVSQCLGPVGGGRRGSGGRVGSAGTGWTRVEARGRSRRTPGLGPEWAPRVRDPSSRQARRALAAGWFPSQYPAPPVPLARPGKEGSPASEVGQWFWIPGVVRSSRGCFCGATIGEGLEEFF